MNDQNQSVDEYYLDVLRHALNHLYDHDQLRSSPLIRLLGLEDQRQPATRLQQLLLDALGDLRPATTEPAGSVKRRIHQVLQLRYEQQFAQKEVAVQLGLSVRQFRRLQQMAVETLALHLSGKYALEVRLAELAPGASSGAPAPDALPESLQWIHSLARTETTPLGRALPEVLRLVQPLAERSGKRLALLGAQECTLAIHPLVFRQAMLHLLNTAILHTEGNEVSANASADRRQAIVAVQVSGAGSAGEQAAGIAGAVELVRQMLAAWQASLRLATCPEGWRAELTCACVQEQPVLVFDDHPDTVDLLKRCVEGTRYRIVAGYEPQHAAAAVQAEQPFIVLLDVMMPGVDGWEVLTQLKQNEATASIPVWVCTVLDQSELALSLGADGFLRKPVTREALLQVLDAQAVRAPALP